MASIGELQYDELLAGGVQKLVTDSIILKAGQAYKRGTVLGLIDAEGKGTAVDSTKTDGSERPYAILAEDTDATLADAVAPVYLTGEFNPAALTFGGTDTADRHKRVLREMGIFLKEVK